MAAESEARRRGADDAVFLSREGVVLEGPVTNVWWRVGERLQTPALELGILAGVTRAEVLQVASRLGYGVEEGRYELERMAVCRRGLHVLVRSRDHARRRARRPARGRRPFRPGVGGRPGGDPRRGIRSRLSPPID